MLVSLGGLLCSSCSCGSGRGWLLELLYCVSSCSPAEKPMLGSGCGPKLRTCRGLDALDALFWAGSGVAGRAASAGGWCWFKDKQAMVNIARQMAPTQ